MIRKAQEGDMPKLEAMAKAFYEASHYIDFAPHHHEACRAILNHLMRDGVLLVDEEVTGMVGLAIVPFLFNPAFTQAAEVVWYVSPEAQGRGVGKALLAAIESACKEAGADVLQMIHLEGSPPQAAAMYERLGLARMEHSYFKRI